MERRFAAKLAVGTPLGECVTHCEPRQLQLGTNGVSRRFPPQHHQADPKQETHYPSQLTGAVASQSMLGLRHKKGKLWQGSGRWFLA